MNQIKKSSVESMGYQFVEPRYLPKGKDEYWLRNLQNTHAAGYRGLIAHEIEVLVRNRNTSDNWNQILVSDAFNPELVQDCKFFGLVRIGKLEPYYLEFHNLRRPVGLYNSTIISSDFGDNVVIDNVNFLSHYIIGNDVMIVNTNEVATTDHAKFGNGIIKEGETESIRIWLEVCNENGGRRIIPFDGMLPGDAYLWSRFRQDGLLQQKFKEFTENKFDGKRGYYGKIGDRTVIKNCKIIKDVMIGSDAYLKGANKLKNLTINSSSLGKTQIGEGCELVNGIIGLGCRIFYGVKAVRFVMASHSQLKYGARLINSYLGNNATISCCEVLNSLIFPAHEQHHNNSFLCAALLGGQTNMAAGATIGSNHNSRGADGEIVAGRGFWPGLCVSLKHNSKFASFIILAKGDYPSELNIPIPFALVSNNVSTDELVIMPAYWFLHNMYGLARNSWKYGKRDMRTDKCQLLEYDFLAPDSVGEMITARMIFELAVAKAFLRRRIAGEFPAERELAAMGKTLLANGDKSVVDLDILVEGFEHSKRKVKLLKVPKAYQLFGELIGYHAVVQLLSYIKENKFGSLEELLASLPLHFSLEGWINVGGQLMPKMAQDKLIKSIHSGRVKDWQGVHRFYETQAESYERDKLLHALAAWQHTNGIRFRKISGGQVKKMLQGALATRTWMAEGIFQSRAKDYANPFRKMVYESTAEMNAVLGALDENAFILEENQGLEAFTKEIRSLIRLFKLTGQ